ncbi:hypothetical protein V2A60_003333 [Cordyceps javanica]|uniref:Uncharacterized protein n=1 Tax=Cordyceps javanica TaxID=43265 RepID=A0A545W0P9_9HYPO|nr:hypothetical protein IF1G_04815 [Cordyceps javanica]TQW07534.1 mitochondrial ATPase inhibitor, IATP domain-containing protein [Cordyceps javanica]
MASLSQQRYPSRLSHDSTHPKIRSRTIVKPILKKLNSHSTSDRGSFDLDPAWDDLPSPLGYPSADYESLYTDATTPAAHDVSSAAPSSVNTHGDFFRARDVSFSTSSASLEYPTWRSKNKYSHMRSTSGTSHTSSITTNVSARNGTFVHPFQQTPRTATPSLSYANSIASLDISAPGAREYASTITEDDDLISPTTTAITTNLPPRAASLTKSSASSPYTTPYALNSRLRGPSLDESHPSPALSDDTQTPRRVTASRSNSATTALYVPEPSPPESALSSTTPLQMAPISASMSTSPTPTSSSPLSPLRNSLDISGFRLRSRSEVDTRTHQEQVREARRKFQEKEKAKEEKYARQQLRRRERGDHNRDRAKIRKSTTGSTSTAKSSAISSHYAISQDGFHEGSSLFANTGAYDQATAGQTPARADEVQFQRHQRRKTAKHKTNGAWTAFMLWLRTRLLRLGKH